MTVATLSISSDDDGEFSGFSSSFEDDTPLDLAVAVLNASSSRSPLLSASLDLSSSAYMGGEHSAWDPDAPSEDRSSPPLDPTDYRSGMSRQDSLEHLPPARVRLTLPFFSVEESEKLTQDLSSALAASTSALPPSSTPPPSSDEEPQDVHAPPPPPEVSVMFPFSNKMIRESCALLRSTLESRGDEQLLRVLTGIPDWLFERWMFSHTTSTFIGASQRVLELLIHPSLCLPRAILSTPIASPMSLAFARTLSAVLLPHGRYLEFLAWVVQLEVDATESVATLFRGNSSASRLLTAAASLVGQSYLKSTVGWVVQELILPGKILELDPNKMVLPPGSHIRPEVILAQRNQELLEHGDDVFTRVASSVASTPLIMRDIAALIHSTVERKFPGAGHFAVGSFLFLRFLCPAIASPVRYSLVSSQPSQTGHRNLVLLSQMLQKLASGVTTTASKHPHLACYDEFVHAHLDARNAFFDQLVDVPDPTGRSAYAYESGAGAPSAIPETIVLASVNKLAASMASVLPDLLTSCESMAESSWSDTLTIVSAPEVLLHLASVLASPAERSALPFPNLVSLFSRILYEVGGPDLYLALFDVVASSSSRAEQVARAFVTLGLTSEHAEPFINAVTASWIDIKLDGAPGGGPHTRVATLRASDRRSSLRKRCESIRAFSSFMRNSPPSRLLSVYFELVALEALGSVLQPVIGPIAASFKVLDSSCLTNAPASPRARAVLLNFERLVDKLLAGLAATVDVLPHRVRTLCASLDETVGIPFYGPLFFIQRLVIPLLLSPHVYLSDTIQEPTSQGRATLVILSKLLSNLAEGTLFNESDQLAPFNPLLESRRDAMHIVLLSFAGPAQGSDTSSSSSSSSAAARAALASPVRVFVSAKDKRASIQLITNVIEQNVAVVTAAVDQSKMASPLIEAVDYKLGQRLYSVIMAQAASVPTLV